jgi:probable phosphoglycerate mutase
MTTIYLIRHAEAEGNLYRRCQGHYDGQVTANGKAQIAALEERFREIPVDAVYSSDLSRTKATARAIYQPKGLPLHTTPNLREVGAGIWENRTWGDLERSDPESLKRFSACDPTWQVEGSETFPGVRERMTRTLEEIAQAHDGQTVAVVSHGMAIRTTIAGYLGLPMAEVPHCDNTAVAKLEYEGGKMRVCYRGDNSHLSQEISTFAHQAWWREKGGEGEINLWFRPLDPVSEESLYRSCRQEAWITIHKTMEHFDGDRFWFDALDQATYAPESVLVAMHREEIAGLIQMDFRKDAALKIGGIPFFYMMPGFRNRGMGAQLLGQVVSTYRGLGRNRLRLRCSPDNAAARHFYEKYGFRKSGEDPTSAVPLDFLDLTI